MRPPEKPIRNAAWLCSVRPVALSADLDHRQGSLFVDLEHLADLDAAARGAKVGQPLHVRVAALDHVGAALGVGDVGGEIVRKRLAD